MIPDMFTRWKDKVYDNLGKVPVLSEPLSFSEVDYQTQSIYASSYLNPMITGAQKLHVSNVHVLVFVCPHVHSNCNKTKCFSKKTEL